MNSRRIPTVSRRRFILGSAALASSLTGIAPAKAQLSEGIPSDGSPASGAIQRILNATGSVNLPAGEFLLDKPLIPPLGRPMSITGIAPGITILRVPKDTIGIRHVRRSGEGAASIYVQNASLVGDDMSSVGIACHGPSGTDDSSIRMESCELRGLLAPIWLRNSGECHFDRISARFNGVCWVMERATNITRLDGVLCVGNRRFLHLADAAADGVTHGLTLTNSHSIFSAEEDVYLVGGQAIYIDGSSFDLGIGGAAALHIEKCQDFRFSNGWVAAGKEKRDGIHMKESTRWSVATSTINNCWRGIVVSGVNGYPTGGSITGSQFGANRLSDIDLESHTTHTIIENNQFLSLDETFPKTPGRQEIRVSKNDVHSNIVSHNTFSGAEYEIAPGGRSIVGPNIWSTLGYKVSLVFPDYNLDFIPESARFPLNDSVSLTRALERLL